MGYGDPEALGARMLALAGDAPLVQRLGEGARRFAESLSWDRAAQETWRWIEAFSTNRQREASAVASHLLKRRTTLNARNTRLISPVPPLQRWRAVPIQDTCA